MFNIRIVQANYGDSLIIEYGSNAAPRFALVDGGPHDVYRDHLKGELERISSSGGRLDFLAVSHVDGDHITGILDLFSEMERQVANGEPRLIEIDNVWHNSFADTVDNGSGIEARFMAAMNAPDSQVMLQSTAVLNGIWQGNQLRIRAAQLSVLLNDGFADNVVRTDSVGGPIQHDNLTLHVVGPSTENLEALRQEWELWLDKNEPNIASGELIVMSNSDGSIPNLSSIMFIAKADGKTALFTGDGRSDHLLDGLREGGHLDADGRLHVNVLKQMHHGSDRNVTRAFFKTVTADTYIISANGHPDNPDLSTLIWMVEAAKDQDRRIKIMATNETRATRKLRQQYDPVDYGYELEIMSEHYHYWLLEV